MPSIHEGVVKEKVDRLMAEDPKWRALLTEVLHRLNTGFYPEDHVDSIMQYWSIHRYDLYDAYTFSRVHSEILMGSVATAQVNVGAIPGGDKEVEYNNGVLAGSADDVFFGTFYGGLWDNDGTFAWKSPVQFKVQRYNETTRYFLEPEEVSLAPRTVPLEVGYTMGSRTLMHLRAEHALARWPYGSEWITIFVVTTPFPPQPCPYISRPNKSFGSERREGV